MTKQMIIYWYTTTKQFNEIEAGKTYCIGEVDPTAKEYEAMSNMAAAEKRIKQELGRSSKSGTHIKFDQITDMDCRLVEFPNPKNKEKSLDKDVHAVLTEIGCKQIDREWFNTSPEEINRVLDHIEYGSPLGTAYTLRGRQPQAVDRFKKAYNSGETRFGLFAMPRFGKTICSFEMMNYLFEQNPDKRYVFFISAKLDAEQALREDYYKFDQSCKFKLYIYGSNHKPTREQLLDNKWCFFASKQWFDNKTMEDIQREFPIVNTTDCAAVFFDEAHFARMTERAQRTLKMLKPKMQIDITGTPFRLKSNEDYNDNNSYVYSVLDENEDYENATDKNKFRLNNPEMVYITPKNEFFNTDSSFGEFFDSDKCTEQIQKWVKNSFYGDGFNIEGKRLPVTNALVVLPPRRKYCDMFYRAVTEIVQKDKLAIQCVRTSTKDDSNEDYDPDTKRVFTEWNNICKNDKDHFHLLATIGKGLQAVSFPDCHAVIMMCDMTSPEQYIQAAFRAKTPNDQKKEAYVIDYNKGRTLQIIDTFIKNHLFIQACDSNYKHEYERALSTIQIRDHDLSRQFYTFEEIFQTFVSNWNIERITDSIDFDLEKLANKIDLSHVNLADLQKPRQLLLQLSDRGTDYVQPPTTTQDGNTDDNTTTDGVNIDALKERAIEELKRQLLMHGYIPFGGTETDRIKPENINPADIQVRELEIGQEKELRKVWSYLGGDGDLDDIYIDDSYETISLIRWRYRINNSFVNIKGEGNHGQGETNLKKLRAFINAIVRYLPAYFLVSGKVATFEDLQKRFGRQTSAEHIPERQFFRKFMDCGVDYRYVIDILKSCDAGSREQILSFVNDKVDKCYDKKGKIIPEEVLNLLWIYKKDGSRPVPKELADRMRKNKHYDIVICGGYWLTDDKTKMYITDSFSEAEIMKILRPNIEVIHSTDILKTLEQQKEKIMKFKSFIMNPPYGNLHLPILKEMIDMIVENGGNGVSLQPIRWAQDTLWRYKKVTDFAKYGECVERHLDDLHIISATEAVRLFEARFAMDLGIYDFSCDISDKQCLKKLYQDALLEKILDKMLNSDSNTTIGDKIEHDKRTGIRVVVYDIQENGKIGSGAKHMLGVYKTILTQNGLLADGKDWTSAFKRNQYSKPEGSLIPTSVEFQTIEAANNFIDSTKTIFWQYLMLKMHKDIHVPNQWLPFMNDYSEPWTDERFYKYFDITPKEQKTIEKTVKDAKK